MPTNQPPNQPPSRRAQRAAAQARAAAQSAQGQSGQTGQFGQPAQPGRPQPVGAARGRGGYAAGPSGTAVNGTPVSGSPHGGPVGPAGTGRIGAPVRPNGPGPNGPGPGGPGRPNGPGGPGSGFPSPYGSNPNESGPNGYVPNPGRRPPPGGPKPRRLIDYPRWGRSGWTRWLPSWKLISALIGTGIITMFVGLFAAYSATSLPPPDATAAAQATVIYFNDGTTPIGQLAVQNRQNVDFSQIPVHVRDAVLAAEDRTFYTNSGIDPKSIARAVYSNVRGNAQQGGSTISQQYVKNVYDQRDKSYKRKAKEVFLAIKINREIPKDKILERYMNTIYLGQGAYGFQAAAHAYFGPNKRVEDLSVSQGAFLAGIINAPSIANPRGGPKQLARAKFRWGVVLDAMVAENKLDPATRASLKFPATIKPQPQITVKGQNGFLMDMAKREAVQKLGINEDQLSTGGYKIVTTFNQRMVKAAAAAVNKMLPKDTPPGLQIGLGAVDPKTGAVRAIYGGERYVGSGTNNATLAQAEAGSTFKPFGLIAALEDGASLKDTYNGKSPLILKGIKGKDSIKNDGGESYGYINLIDATKHSVNTVYIQLNQDHGAAATRKVAHLAGVPNSVPIEDNIANVLGSAPPHAIDMASAYATIAAQGVRRLPYTIQKVTLLGTGDTKWDMKDRTEGKRVFDAGVMADATYAMQQVIADPTGTGKYAQRLGRPAAGKTGTSSDSKSAWFDGFTPQLSTSVAMYQVAKVKGKYTNLSMDGFGEFNTIFGGGYPCRIWTEFMSAALNGRDVEKFPEPVYGGDISHKAPVKTVVTPTSQPTNDPGDNNSNQPDPPDQPGKPTTAPPPTTSSPSPTRTQPTPPVTITTGNGGGNGGGNGNGNGNGGGGGKGN